ncbi:hypothetical protein LSTR_LSTR017103, partial [Laodelphax striatellus]
LPGSGHIFNTATSQPAVSSTVVQTTQQVVGGGGSSGQVSPPHQNGFTSVGSGPSSVSSVSQAQSPPVSGPAPSQSDINQQASSSQASWPESNNLTHTQRMQPSHHNSYCECPRN